MTGCRSGRQNDQRLGIADLATINGADNNLTGLVTRKYAQEPARSSRHTTPLNLVTSLYLSIDQFRLAS